MKKVILFILIGLTSCSKNIILDYPINRSYEEYEISDSADIKVKSSTIIKAAEDIDNYCEEIINKYISKIQTKLETFEYWNQSSQIRTKGPPHVQCCEVRHWYLPRGNGSSPGLMYELPDQ